MPQYPSRVKGFVPLPPESETATVSQEAVAGICGASGAQLDEAASEPGMLSFKS